MTFLPVVERELRVAARRRTTYLVRFATVVVALGLAAWTLKESNYSQSVGSDLFGVLATLLFLYAGIFGVFVTADCMSEEKREGTLGLLFLTDLKGYDVVFGKLTATSLNLFYGMLAVFPVLAVPLLMGGVSQKELLRVVLMLVNLMCFSLSIGIWASALCKRPGRAHALAIVVLLALLFAWPLATQLRQTPVVDSRLAYLPSPIYGCVLAFDTNYKLGQRMDFWMNALITQLYAWFFFGMACWLAPRSWQDAVAGKTSWWRWRNFTSAARAQLLSVNPYLWRALRTRSKCIAVWVMLAFMAGFWDWLRWLNRGWILPIGDNYFEPAVDLTCLVLAGFAIKVWVALESGRALGEDRRSGALELLLSTPMEPAEVVQGQRLALWRQFAGPIWVLLAANAFFLLMELRYMPRIAGVGEDRLETIYGHAVIGVFLVVDSIALSSLGMRFGFRARKPMRAVMLVLLCVMGLPVLLFFLLTGFLIVPGAMGVEWTPWTMLLSWCVLGLAADLYAIDSREKLVAEFSAFASEGRPRKTPKQPQCSAAPALAEIS
jgi:ABC-type transport system involved in multi-copper enzyme maturation permease subunit